MSIQTYNLLNIGLRSFAMGACVEAVMILFKIYKGF